MSFIDEQEAFIPRNPDFRERVSVSFAAQTAMQSLGVVLTHVGPGHVEFTMPFNPGFSQQDGFMHAGAIATPLDSACGYAAFSLMSLDAQVLTAEFKINLLAPAQGDEFLLIGRVIKPGRTLFLSEGRAFAITKGESKLIATMTATNMALYGKQGD